MGQAQNVVGNGHVVACFISLSRASALSVVLTLLLRNEQVMHYYAWLELTKNKTKAKVAMQFVCKVVSASQPFNFYFEL